MSGADAYDAIVLAGGRGSRLGGVAKPLLVRNDRTLLAGVLDAVADAAHIVVVGPPSLAAHVGAHALVREDPPLGGPVPAIAAGLDALPAGAARIVLLAGDLVDPAAAVAALVAVADRPGAPAAPGSTSPGSTASLGSTPPGLPPRGAPADGVITIDPDGRRQPLLAIYDGAALRSAIGALSADGPLDGLPLRRLIEPLDLRELPLPAAQLRDLDTAADAAEFDVDLPPGHPPP
ncbi:hypothetical protein ARHIZOSPH14_14290 [Agromyces rhizosphaerae]|uniref:MobA-like NTP transferase domain-containing protein n=1 Tax=Agromyces rhizosphaerae TaxID=88374 RepID=A0A9W6CXS1_9MICO|nr:NTP transferase domain-containing protein [Agromyces rhizosphaerae]GLI27187.1 hypothetical protein ARHIZOSPH14_14290 [Agromyces rhizosphaerae]